MQMLNTPAARPTRTSPWLVAHSLVWFRLTDQSQLQAFEWYSKGGGEHWNRLNKLAPDLGSIGITAFWIPREFSSFLVEQAI
jgi:hypothetical protein